MGKDFTEQHSFLIFYRQNLEKQMEGKEHNKEEKTLKIPTLA
jgi:hypothetical protein